MRLMLFSYFPPEGGKTNMLSWGFATEGVCVRGGPHVAKADNE